MLAAVEESVLSLQIGIPAVVAVLTFLSAHGIKLGVDKIRRNGRNPLDLNCHEGFQGWLKKLDKKVDNLPCPEHSERMGTLEQAVKDNDKHTSESLQRVEAGLEKLRDAVLKQG